MSDLKQQAAGNPAKPFRFGKGEATIALSAAVFAAGLAVLFLGDPWAVAPGVMLVGFSALVGSYTNRIAIEALFEYWPAWPGVRSLLPKGLPFTGILKEKKDEIVDGLAAEIRDLLSAETFRAEVEEKLSSDSVRQALRSAAGKDGVRRMAEGLIDSKAFTSLRNSLADAIEKSAAGSGAGTLGKVLSLPGFLEGAGAAVASRLDALAADDAKVAELAEIVSKEGAAALDSPQAVSAVAKAVESSLPRGGALAAIIDPSFAAHEVLRGLKHALASREDAAAGLVKAALKSAAAKTRSLGPGVAGADWAAGALEAAFGIGASEAAAALRNWSPQVRRRFLVLVRVGFRRAPQAAAGLLDLLESMPVAGGDLLGAIASTLSKKASDIAIEKMRAMSTDEINRRIRGVSGDYLAWLEVYGGVMGAIGGVAMAIVFGFLGI